MTENTIFIKKYDGKSDVFAVNEKEVWRYAGYAGLSANKDDELYKVYEQAVDECNKILSYKVCYRRMEVSWEEEMPNLPFEAKSKDLAKCIKGSSEIILFAATIGLDIDRLIARYQRFSPTKALLLQAFGAERVERLCDVFCDEIKNEVSKEKLFCTPRFSPGYGDLPLESQREVFRLLDCNRQIGISLNESLLMTPSKSVTALFGLGQCEVPSNEHKCNDCGKEDCEFKE